MSFLSDPLDDAPDDPEQLSAFAEEWNALQVRRRTIR